MLTAINPKLPMRDKNVTMDFYTKPLGFKIFGREEFDGYLMMEKDRIQIHFLNLKNLTQKKTMDKFISEPITLTMFLSLYWIIKQQSTPMVH